MQILHTPHRGTSVCVCVCVCVGGEGGKGVMGPLPRVFDMLRYFELILPSVESLYLPILSTR